MQNMNLRVVDASVFPMQLRGNIQSTVYAIAEYAADMIKANGFEVARMVIYTKVR